MGLLRLIFGGNEDNVQVERIDENNESYQQYMAGFRAGYPLEGEPAVTLPESVTSSQEYQRGLLEAQKQFEQAGKPVIRYDG